MTPPLRTAGEPTPLALDTHADDTLRPPIPYDPDDVRFVAGSPAARASGDWIDADIATLSAPIEAPGWLGTATGLIRPICVGALMAIPTLGAATVGAVALLDGGAADRMTRASTAFLGGLPDGVLWLIGALAGGYTVARTTEKLADRHAEGKL